MPTSMTRAGSNLPNGHFIPEIWSKKINAKYYPNSVLDEIVNRNWEGDIKGQGSKVMIRKRPTITVGDYSVDGTINYQDLTDEKVELTIDQAKYFAFKVDDVDQAQADIKILNECSQDAARQSATVVDQAVLGSIYSSATSALSSTAILKTTVLDWIIDAMVKLDEYNAPTEGRFVVIPPWISGMVMKSDLKDASLAGDPTSIMRNGRLGMIGNATLYVSNNISDNGTTWQCMAGHKDATAFASQITKVEDVRLQNTFGDAIRGLNVYGFKVVQGDALVSMPATKS